MEIAEPELGAGFGERLRRAREQRGLSVEECAERLYLPATVIASLESEQFAELGAGVYARGHLRRYACLLEMDAVNLEQQMVQRLSAAPDLTDIQTRRLGQAVQARRFGLMPVAIVAALLAIGVLVWWSIRHADDRSQEVPVPVPVTPSANEPAGASTTGSLTVPDSTGATVVAEPAATPAAATSPAVPAASDSLVIAAARPVAPPASTPAAAPATRSPAAVTRPVAAEGQTSGQTSSQASGQTSSQASGQSSGQAAGSAASSASAARRRTAPAPVPASAQKPATPAVPHETQRDYMNFDF